MTKIKDIPKVNRPRERFLEKGSNSLSKSELLSILIGSGIKGKNVKKLSEQIIRKFGNLFLDITVENLLEIQGIGKVKALQIVAAIALVKRFYDEQKSTENIILSATDVIDLYKELKDKKKEYLVCLFLDARNSLISKEVISIGTLDKSIIHPREIFGPAIELRSASIILLHNHPSGESNPSNGDIVIMHKIVEAGKLLGINVIDFIIIAKDNSYSFFNSLQKEKDQIVNYISEGIQLSLLDLLEIERPSYKPLIKKSSIVFRNSIPEIPTTTYGTFSIFKYPAKFIPQVIAYALKEYARNGMEIFDPFAGYGTVGLVSRIYGYNYELWDLNPIIETIHKTALLSVPKIDVSKIIKDIKQCNEVFVPEWSNLGYWIPDRFLPIISKAWGFVHSQNDEIKYLLTIPLLKTTRFFSHSDEKIHKLYKSKFSRQKIEKLFREDWETKFYKMIKREVTILIRKIHEYSKLNPQKVESKIISGKDIFENKLESNKNILITSPPYLQAQEYIRSTKLELFFLGYEEKYIKQLGKKEIPYNHVKGIDIFSEKYFHYRERIQEEHLIKLYDRYFHSTLNIFQTLGKSITDYMFIFVGSAKIRTTPIPIDEIIIEHLSNFGWIHEITLVDKIVSRVMFQSKINPASKNEDSRIRTENLVILKRGY